MKTKKKIKNILDNFNFEEVHNYMMHRNPPWTWADGFVPTETALRRRAKELLKDVAAFKRKTAYIATGGFFAMKWYKELHLMFYIAEGFEGDE